MEISGVEALEDRDFSGINSFDFAKNQRNAQSYCAKYSRDMRFYQNLPAILHPWFTKSRDRKEQLMTNEAQ
jgi:hypothetical protein